VIPKISAMRRNTGRLVIRVRSRLRRDLARNRVLAYCMAGLVIVGTIVAAGWNNGYPAEKVRLLSGAAWLPSNQVGELALVDGPSAEIAAQVQVAAPGHRLDAVQDGTTVYVLDRTTASIRRIDGDTFAQTQPTTPIPEAVEGLNIYLNPTGLYTLDTLRGLLTDSDPTTLTSRGAPLPLTANAATLVATVDDTGRLWVLDTTTGDLIWIRSRHRGARRQAVQPGAGTLVTTNGSPVLIDHHGQTAFALDPDTGEARHTTQLGLTPADKIEASGSQHKSRLYVVSARGQLAVCDLTGTSCGTEIPLGPPGAEFGAPVETGETVFVPDYTTGQVWIADLAAKRIVAQPQVISPATHFQLLAHEGIVYFNDPDSEQAGVIRPDGAVIKITKYHPTKPDQRVTTTAPKPGSPSSIASPAPGTTSRSGKPPSQPGQPQPPSTSPSSGMPLVRIMVSNHQPDVGEEVTIRATAESGPDPVGALWDFGDGAGSNDVRTSHRWTTPNVYSISVRATLANGKTAVATLPINVGAPAKKSLLVQTSGLGIVSSQPAGISCPPTCYAIFDVGHAVTLTAQPDAGFNFIAWDGDCAGADLTCTVVMDTTRTASGRFQPTNGDFTVGALNDRTCDVRHGTDGYWDIDLWFLIGWTSTKGIPMPPSMLRVVTDVGISQDWPFSRFSLMLNQINLLVDQDVRNLGRIMRLTVTIDPDNAVVEASEANNTIVLAIDLRAGLPPPGSRQAVECRQE
jgi:outer membrane protein assembly factor BamB